MTIENVGLAMDTLETRDGIVYGNATVYSKDEDGLELEYCDDFDFTYCISGNFATTGLDDKVFGKYFNEIEELLIDNLKTNYLQNN